MALVGDPDPLPIPLIFGSSRSARGDRGSTAARPATGHGPVHTSPAATAGSTKILPSPMRPVRAATTIRSTTSSTRASSTQS